MVSKVYNIQGISVSLKQIIIVIVTSLLLALFWYLVNKTSLGRAQREYEQDRKMAALLGIDVDGTISITFVMGAALAAVAGTLFLMYYGVIAFFHGFVPSVKPSRRQCSAASARCPAVLVMIGATEILRELDFLKAVFGPDFTPELYRMLLFGMAMLIVMLWKPRGFVGSREPTAFLKQRRAVSALLHLGGSRLMNATPFSNDFILLVEHLSIKIGGLVAIGDLSF